ncbi:MAG: HNH endonuclease [Actinomycetota bacterium]|nr:HNH endonuclease [Actinomycetota bacterium]
MTTTTSTATCAGKAMTELAATDVSGCDRDELARVVMLGRRVRSFLDTIDVQVARRSDQLCDQGHGDPAPIVLGDGGRRPAREARAATKRAKICDRLPQLGQALADGEVTGAHVDAVAQLADGLDEQAHERLAGVAEALVADAARQPISTFERACRELKDHLSIDDGIETLKRQQANTKVRRWINRTTGMYHLHAELDPESGAKMFGALDAHIATLRRNGQNGENGSIGANGTEPMPLERVEAQALVELVTGARSVDRRVPEVSVLIDYLTLIGGLHDHSICELSDGTPLPPDTVRRLACEAAIIPICLGGDPERVDVGREQRLANRAQRRALRAMYRSCGHPGCDVPFDRCDIHHALAWERFFGRTDLGNLIPLCTRHHHTVHEGGWTLTLDPDRTITLQRPDGTNAFCGDTTNRKPAPRTVTAIEPVSPKRTDRAPPTLRDPVPVRC